MTIFLPARRRASARAFWITISALLAAGLSAFQRPLGWSRFITAEIVVALVFAVVLTQEGLLNKVYGGWNWLLARGFAPLARSVATRLAYGIVICAGLKKDSSRLTLGTANKPGVVWSPPGPHRQAELRERRLGQSWRRQVGWAIQSRQAWSLALIPLLAILRVCSDESASAPAIENNYTLF